MKEKMRDDIKLIAANEVNARVLWEWRNHPEVRKNFFNTNPISLEDHEVWFSGRLKDPYVKIYIAICKEHEIGVIRFESEDQSVGVSVSLNPAFFGKGFGSEIIRYGTEKFLKEMNPERSIVARIKKNNIASQKAFAKAGYEIAEIKKEEFVYMHNDTGRLSP